MFLLPSPKESNFGLGILQLGLFWFSKISVGFQTDTRELPLRRDPHLGTGRVNAPLPIEALGVQADANLHLVHPAHASF